MKPVIRDAREEDLPTLVNFLASLALHVSGAPPQELKASERERLTQSLQRAMASPDRKILVAEATGGVLAGMGDISVWSSQGIWEQAQDVVYRSAVIDDVWVEPDFRGLGLFKDILRVLVDFAAQRGAQELVLEYSASNKEAKTAWTKLGFKTTGVRAAAFTQNIQEALAGPR
ncbi:GNAT family N-acetyltransferase [Marinobacter sp. CHS3-4]|uniref:GNAT family N-acetyltransferase n=1 Tax=Marinobacter sp. CHS3-4 TaxID=3045174 RepID=UPI0024B4E860|nr:GNAT family N-acetyltransferase [Marinobacter sp. CHS3-4]MDI9244721.1 GNAT family N-acetyltransferase [Marinobacter sp. CHS3-4]